MADHTAPEVLARLATLETRLAAQEAINHQQGRELAWHRKRRRYGRSARRLLPVMLAALLVALVPLATLAANPFTDLTGGPHDANIDAIYNTGITTGCDPGVAYCPTDTVTREEMASFLARTAGLGGNPPIANALTAQTAGHAATADGATAAGNANTVGGYAPSGLVRAARGTGGGTASTSAYVPILTIAIEAPSAGVVIVTAGANALSVGNGTRTCPCEGYVQLVHVQRPAIEPIRHAVHIPSFSDLAANEDGASISYAFPVNAGANTFQLQGNREFGTANIQYIGQGSALFVPFGEGGGATITEQGEPPLPPAKP